MSHCVYKYAHMYVCMSACDIVCNSSWMNTQSMTYDCKEAHFIKQCDILISANEKKECTCTSKYNLYDLFLWFSYIDREL